MGSCNLNSQCTCIKKCKDGDDEDPERSEKKSTPSPTQTNLQSRHGEASKKTKRTSYISCKEGLI